MAFISTGPDRVLSPNLQTALNSVRSRVSGGTATAADMRDILSLSADLDRSAGNFTDDIVHTFSNLTTQQERWDYVSNNVERIMARMQESYISQYNAFLPDLRDYYGTGALFPTDPNAWKQVPLAGKPTLSIPDLNTGTGRLSLGIDDAFAAITDAAPNGSSLEIQHDWYSTVTGVTDSFDGMRLNLVNNGSPWTVNYTRDMDMVP
jgi:hypothetical protein